jgi:hypothetical protein
VIVVWNFHADDRQIMLMAEAAVSEWKKPCTTYCMCFIARHREFVGFRTVISGGYRKNM